MENTERLVNILEKLSKNPQASFQECEEDFISHADFGEMAIAQQTMLKNGVEAEELLAVWRAYKHILPDQVSCLRKEIDENHVLRKVLAEHEMMLCFIADLEDVTKDINVLETGSSLTHEIRRIGHISSHLVYSEQHREREEELIFPELRSRGYTEVLQILSKQHWEISRANYKLHGLIWKVDEIEFDEFKRKLNELVGFVVPAMRLHLFIEGNVVFPLAVAVIKSKRVWDRMKTVADEIGYCGYDGK